MSKQLNQIGKRNLRTSIAAVLALGLWATSAATCWGKITPLGYYQLGAGSSITYAAGPLTLQDKSGEAHDLKRHGNPLFVASTPALTSVPAQGALKFNGQAFYSRAGALFKPGDQFGLEVWVNAARQNDPGLHGAVANGDGALGYVLGQQNNRWVAFVGCVGALDMGPVVPDHWTDLALVREGNTCVAYRDGHEVGTSALTPGIHPYFRIGTAGLPTEGFDGLIHAARAFTYTGSKFDPLTDLLLNQEKIRQQVAADAARQSKLISSLLREQPGVSVVNSLMVQPPKVDWLIHRVQQPVRLLIKPSADKQTAMMVLANGLISRTFYVADNLACVGFKNLSNGAEYLRAVKPEMRLKLNNRWYDVGGLQGQPEHSYLLDQWLARMHGDPGAFQFTGITTGPPQARYPWKPKFHAMPTAWPPRGLRVAMHYQAPASMGAAYSNLTLTVYYEMYEGIPVVAKWFALDNGTNKPVEIEKNETEMLAVTPEQVNRIHVESNYSFHLVNNEVRGVHMALAGESHRTDVPAYLAGGTTTLWKVDPDFNNYATPTSYEDDLQNHWFRNLLISRLPMGPDQLVGNGGQFDSFITFELLQDSDDRERQSLGIRRFYAKLAPQVTENLLCASTRSHDPAVVKHLIDQMAECGFERLDITFWPGIHYEDLDPKYVAKWRDIAQYALSKGIVTGGYELMVASRNAGPEEDVVNPATGKPGSATFGQSVCIASKWADTFYPKIWKFIDKTGFRIIGIDGPYHGDPCAATNHPYHRGLLDSQWAQWKQQVTYFHECQRRNMWAPAPDWYFLNGEACTGMGYREASANLSRALGRLLYRQYLYDGTWFKIPPMGWFTIGLTGTYNNDPRTMLEPLSQHLEDYAKLMIQTLGYGAQTTFLCNNRLYDTAKTKALVLKWVNWYKKYRDILNSDIIHVRRPDGRNYDCIVHVNPFIAHRGLALYFNPTDHEIDRQTTLPLYYTGLSKAAVLHQNGKAKQRVQLDPQANATISLHIPAHGFVWYLIEK